MIGTVLASMPHCAGTVLDARPLRQQRHKSIDTVSFAPNASATTVVCPRKAASARHPTGQTIPSNRSPSAFVGVPASGHHPTCPQIPPPSAAAPSLAASSQPTAHAHAIRWPSANGTIHGGTDTKASNDGVGGSASRSSFTSDPRRCGSGWPIRSGNRNRPRTGPRRPHR